MPVIGKPEVVKEAEISALRRAIAVERKAYYADFQGKQSTFSQFMRRTAERLCKRYPAETLWTTIRGLFRQYPNVDVATRISIVRRAEELIAPHFQIAEVSDEINGVQRDDTDDNLGSPSGSQSNQGSGSKSDSAVGPDAKPARSAGSSPGTTRKPSVPTSGSANGAVPSTSESKQSSGAASKSSAVSKTNSSATPAGEAAPKPVPRGSGALTPVQFVKGVGPKFGAVLNQFGIATVGDLLCHYPRRHLDFQNRSFIKQLQVGQEVTVFGAIRSVSAYQSKNKNMSILNILIGDGSGNLSITKFIGGRSNKYLLDRYKNQYPKSAQVLASGIADRDKFTGRMTLKNAEVEVLGFTSEADGDDTDSASASIHAGRLVPVYPLTEGLSLKHLRNVIYHAIEGFSHEIKDHLADSIRSELDLCDLNVAYEQIHFPRDLESYERARRRLVFDELFSIQLELAQRRYKFDQSEGALQIQYKQDGLVDRLLQSLPFKLTGAQQRVFGEIERDLASSKPMHRLVQGDVGSGKTIVALLALMIAIENNYQGVMMAPTEILAEQHYRQFQRLITPLGLRCCLVIGKQGQKERREVRQQLLAGQINIAVGTHALLEQDVEFQNLGLIIIDEQHRFGVKQRARLKAKSQSPELLTMTATPIPRTLALTMHGDLDVSEIDELPPGRKPIKTKMLKPGQRKELLKFIREQVDIGRQAYVVFPLIEESESLSAKAATQEFERLQYEPEFAGLKIGLMHGKLKPQEKDEVMEQFRTGQFHILVCTTVIEVGVDVPNASVMVIENADRFGLSQLHQLRGRVGRGADQSFCFLVADAKADTTRERLGIMEQTNDGFVIATKDLELRGPGEFMGFKQSGLPDMVLADLVKDAKTLEEARNAAIALVKEDPDLSEHKLLQELMSRKTKIVESDVMRSG